MPEYPNPLTAAPYAPTAQSGAYGAPNMPGMPDMGHYGMDDITTDIPAETLRKAAIRNAITETAGDPESLIGSLADSVHMLLMLNANLITALATAKGSQLKPLREALEPWRPVADTITTAHDAGDVVMPYEVKGLDASLAKILTKAAATARVFSARADSTSASQTAAV